MQTPDEPKYDVEWADLERRESLLQFVAGCWMVMAFVPWLPVLAVGALVFFVTDHLGSSLLALQIVLTLAIVLGAMAAPVLYRNTFPCPRCKRPFFIFSWGIPPEMGDGRRCPHCRLMRGQ